MLESDKKMSEAAEPGQRVRHLRVSPNDDGQRVDNFLLKHCPGVPRTHIYRIIRKGEVRVDGGRIKPTRKLLAGEQVRVPPMRVKTRAEIRVPDSAIQVLETRVLFEHADFIAVNKPDGMAVHGGSGLAFGVIDVLRQIYAKPELELIHRLDRGTSGCLLIGRTRQATSAVQELFRARTIAKRYVALVSGDWPQQNTTISVSLASNSEHAGERRVLVDANGQSAVTHFSVRQRFAADAVRPAACLLDIDLETGRTHQIRVHARHHGHAVVGDTRYGDNRDNTRFRRCGLKRLFLHSAELKFDWRGETVEINAPVDEQWTSALSGLGQA